METGKDTRTPELEVRKAEGFFEAVRQAAWQHIESKYKGAEFEHLVRRLFECIYKDGRVEHWGGAGEKGADLIVFTQDPLGIEYKIAVQIKLHEGVEHDTTALAQIENAKEHHKIDAGVVVTMAEQISEAFQVRREELEEELGIDIRVVSRDEFIELVMDHLGKAKANTSEATIDLLRRSAIKPEPLECTPVTDRIYEELQRLPFTEAQRERMDVFHQNRGGGIHLVRVELPSGTKGAKDQAAQAIAEYIEQAVPQARDRRVEVTSRGDPGASTVRVDVTIELP